MTNNNINDSQKTSILAVSSSSHSPKSAWIRRHFGDACDIYGRVILMRSIADRLGDGNNADLFMFCTGWLRKIDKPGVHPQVAHEYAIYEQLDLAGLCGKIVPRCDFERGIFGYPDSIVISRIDDCATLYEYAMQVNLGAMQEPLWLELCKAVGRVIQQFHQADFTHCDLHAGNIVIELHDYEWYPFLIDFGVSDHPAVELHYPPVDEAILEQDHDIKVLLESLEDSDFSR